MATEMMMAAICYSIIDELKTQSVISLAYRGQCAQ